MSNLIAKMKLANGADDCTCNVADHSFSAADHDEYCAFPLLQQAVIEIEQLRTALRASDRALDEAREMLGVFEDHGGHDGLGGKGYLATIDHMDNARAENRRLLA